MQDLLFYIFSTLTLLCGLLVVFNPFSRNPVTSAMFLVLTIISMSGLFVLLQAYFLAAVQNSMLLADDPPGIGALTKAAESSQQFHEHSSATEDSLMVLWVKPVSAREYSGGESADGEWNGETWGAEYWRAEYWDADNWGAAEASRGSSWQRHSPY